MFPLSWKNAILLSQPMLKVSCSPVGLAHTTDTSFAISAKADCGISKGQSIEYVATNDAASRRSFFKKPLGIFRAPQNLNYTGFQFLRTINFDAGF